MFAKITALAAVAGLVQSAAASNIHRNMHKRDVVTVLETVVVTGDSTVATQAPAVQDDAYQPAATTTAAPVVAQTTAAAPATKTTATGSSSGSSSSGVSVKRGLAYTDSSLLASFAEQCGDKCGWAYNWDCKSNGDVPSGLTYIPMLWNTSAARVSDWQNNMDTIKSSKILFSFNEPEASAQANMDVGLAVSEHATYFKDLRDGYKVGTPSVTNNMQDANLGVGYLTQFIDGCNTNSDCHFEFCNVHWYNSVAYQTSLDDLITAVSKICKNGGDTLPVWVTEFNSGADQYGDFGSVEERVQILDYALKLMDAPSSPVEAYAYFMIDQSVFTTGTTLADDGSKYASYVYSA